MLYDVHIHIVNLSINVGCVIQNQTDGFPVPGTYKCDVLHSTRFVYIATDNDSTRDVTAGQVTSLEGKVGCPLPP